MAHPADRIGRNILEQFGGIVHPDFCFTILTHRRALNLAAQHKRHKLRSIAKSQHWNTHFKKLLGAGCRPLFIAAARPAGQNDALGLHRFYFLKICLIRIDFAVDIALSDTPCNQLVVLPAKVNYHYKFFVHACPP